VGVDILNVTVGIVSGFGNVLTGSESNLSYIKFATLA